MIDIVVPFEQEGTKAVVRSWLKKVGDVVAEHDPLVELETDKVTQEVPSPGAGVLVEILLDTDAEAVPGSILGRIADVKAEAAHVGAPVKEAESGLATTSDATPAPAKSSDAVAAMAGILSPSVRRAIRQHDIDPSTIPGTGRGGRVTRSDVGQIVAERGASVVPIERATPMPEVSTRRAEETAPEGTAIPPQGIRSVPHDRMRRAIAQNMRDSVTAAPHVTAMFECDFSAIMAHRKRHREAYVTQGANLTFTAYLMLASVTAMRAAPAINSRWFDDRLEIYDDVSIGIGTALGDEGLVVPVIARVQELSLLGVATRLSDLTARARAKKLQPSEMRGGTFTISNHGVSGSLIATPIIIVQPQSAILGVGKLEKRVVVREVDGVDTIQIRPMCYVTLTIDHRVVDGHQTNAWLTAFVKAIEDWPLEE